MLVSTTPTARSSTRGFLSGIVFSGANQVPAGRFRHRDGPRRSKVSICRTVSSPFSPACDTNVGPRYFGEAVTGLNRALQLAGARNTITSLWKVHDEGTEVFFRAFYHALWHDGRSLVDAFAEARRVTREARWGPGVWAGFVLYTRG